VIITGAASGIGRACALEFAKEGANVVVADINLSKAKETVKRIKAAGGSAAACQTDVSEPDSVRHLIETSLKKFKSIYTLINNAAIQINKTIEDTTVEEWTLQLSINLGGVFLCSKYCLPHLKKT